MRGCERMTNAQVVGVVGRGGTAGGAREGGRRTGLWRGGGGERDRFGKRSREGRRVANLVPVVQAQRRDHQRFVRDYVERGGCATVGGCDVAPSPPGVVTVATCPGPAPLLRNITLLHTEREIRASSGMRVSSSEAGD